MRIICIAGGKGTIKKKIAERLTKFGYSRLLSYTTREPKENEVHGVDYYFVNKNQFWEIVKKDMVMEWEELNGEYYGSSHPIGVHNNVIVTEEKGFKDIQKIYGKKQVTGVYIHTENEEINKEFDLNLSNEVGEREAVIQILQFISKKGEQI